MNFPSAHLQFLATYASYANHPYAPPVCRQARAELERIESVAADSQPGPAAHAEQQRNLPAADPVPAEQSGPGPQSDLFV